MWTAFIISHVSSVRSFSSFGSFGFSIFKTSNITCPKNDRCGFGVPDVAFGRTEHREGIRDWLVGVLRVSVVLDGIGEFG